MNRNTPLPNLVATIGALAGLAALGAALIVSPGAASPLPTKVAAANVAASSTAPGAVATARQAEAAKPASATAAASMTPDTSAAPKRVVRVVYVGPITGK